MLFRSPHYELGEVEKRELLVDGLLARAEAERIVHRVLDSLHDLGVRSLGLTESPIAGGKSSRRVKRRRRAKADANAPTSGPADQLGNHEWLALLEPVNS